MRLRGLSGRLEVTDEADKGGTEAPSTWRMAVLSGAVLCLLLAVAPPAAAKSDDRKPP